MPGDGPLEKKNSVHIWKSQKRFPALFRIGFKNKKQIDIFRRFLINLLQNISFPKSFLTASAIFRGIYQTQSKHSRLRLQKNTRRLFFTTKDPEVSGTHFIDRGWM